MALRRTLRTVRSKCNFKFALSDGHSGTLADTLKSPVPDLLNTNLPPTETQIYNVLKAIAGTETELSSIEYQIHCTDDEDETQKLIRRQAACQEFVEVHRRVLSLSRRLPTEVLQEIFSWFLPADPSPDAYIRSWFIRSWTPIRLVCHQWKAAVHSLPELFGILPSFPLNKKTEDPRYISQFSRWLSFSKHAPLYVCVIAPFREYDKHPALEALMDHSHRWVALTMETTFMTVKSLSRVRRKMGALRYLTLDVWRYNSQESPLTVFKHATSLRNVVVNGIFPRGLALPWAGLESYREKVINRGGLAEVVTNSLRLQRLEITQIIDVPLFGPITLPALKDLRFRYDDVIPPDNAVNMMTLPALEDAQVIGSSGELIPVLIALVSRSDCNNLRRLAFRTQAVMVPGELTKLLETTPNLVELDIRHPPNIDAERLVYDPHVTPLVPLLERLYIHSNGNWGDEETYRRIGSTRCDVDPSLPCGIVPLKVLRFIFEFEHVGFCTTQQAVLEDWFNPRKRASRQVQQLLEYKNNLLLHLPEIDEKMNWDPNAPKKRAFDLTYAKRLHGTLLDIEGVVVMDVHDLHLSELHLILKRVSRLGAGRIPSEDRYHFRERAEKIVKGWNPLFVQVIDQLRWVRVGKLSLEYVSTFSDLRDHPDDEVVEKLVYGIEDWIHEFDLLWHRYM
ncbi:hypothetical protein FA15DRAFT_404536 [Coprinopsis marcescibilis]|uniref:Uncharacterized protein n=1 Tax=Coprinopsis marcescibilis TaxID=230819 RepID=A0A5C3KWH6_COPMA|nr:hypothetical protein FA15DRAFT_404536 [Coprinopsis marcescibilis]